MKPEPLSGLPVALARVSCSGERHTIRWDRGELLVLDHDDPEGERALAALGGASCTCLDILGAWARQRDNPALLSALSRGSHDQVQAEAFQAGPFAAYPASMTPNASTPRNVLTSSRGGARTLGGWVSVIGTAVGPAVAVPGTTTPRPTGSTTPESEVALLAGLGHELTLRLAATVTASLLHRLERTDGPSVQPALEASLFGRASCAIRAWLGTPDLDVELEVVEDAADAGLEGDARGPIRLRLPLSWVITVWGRDLTVVAGRFCLAVVESNLRRTKLMSVSSDLAPPRPLVVEIL